VKTEERLAVPWDARDLVTQVKALLPEGQTVALRDKGITELPLARLKAQLSRHGYAIRATKGRNPRRLVACINAEGRLEQYGLFELRQLSSSMQGETDGKDK
jgi:hypothetical protein